MLGNRMSGWSKKRKHHRLRVGYVFLSSIGFCYELIGEYAVNKSLCD